MAKRRTAHRNRWAFSQLESVRQGRGVRVLPMQHNTTPHDIPLSPFPHLTPAPPPRPRPAGASSLPASGRVVGAGSAFARLSPCAGASPQPPALLSHGLGECGRPPIAPARRSAMVRRGAMVRRSAMVRRGAMVARSLGALAPRRRRCPSLGRLHAWPQSNPPGR